MLSHDDKQAIQERLSEVREEYYSKNDTTIEALEKLLSEDKKFKKNIQELKILTAEIDREIKAGNYARDHELAELKLNQEKLKAERKKNYKPMKELTAELNFYQKVIPYINGLITFLDSDAELDSIDKIFEKNSPAIIEIETELKTSLLEAVKLSQTSKDSASLISNAAPLEKDSIQPTQSASSPRPLTAQIVTSSPLDDIQKSINIQPSINDNLAKLVEKLRSISGDYEPGTNKMKKLTEVLNTQHRTDSKKSAINSAIQKLEGITAPDARQQAFNEIAHAFRRRDKHQSVDPNLKEHDALINALFQHRSNFTSCISYFKKPDSAVEFNKFLDSIALKTESAKKPIPDPSKHWSDASLLRYGNKNVVTTPESNAPGTAGQNGKAAKPTEESTPSPGNG